MSNKAFALCALATVLAAPAQAEKADSSKPIALTAARGSLDQLKGVTVAEGDVVAEQGTLRIHADKIVVTQDAKGNQVMVANGRPVTFRQKVEGKNEYVEGEGLRVDYATQTSVAILTGSAKVRRGTDSVTGDVITYNTETEVYEAIGSNPQVSGNTKGRVTVILQPKPKAPAPAASAGDAKVKP